jgi:uncharacterized protein (DUF2235 family)
LWEATVPKNIVLLSDGTGNSAAKLFKTNVWRIYEALDLGPASNQIAYYDDGVGTSSFRPIALLTGAFGFGLKRNVKTIYAFLCRNYDRDDNIYAFGFSRGAFTIRTLMGMIGTQGIVPGRTMTPDQLSDAVSSAYRRYKATYRTNWRWGLHAVQRIFGAGAPDRKPAIPAGHHAPPITFLGLWDTVDAYGLPIEELKLGWDKWVWPLSFPDRDLSPMVQRACHALAIDDERRTFHPVLWNEAPEKELVAAGKVAPGRVSQVWFSGMHSNVGGGYPKDGLAYVSLIWILNEAISRGMKVYPSALQEFQQLADAHAVMGDSRAGLAAYYRYDPRRISALCKDDFRKVDIERPKIHDSVLERIKGQRLPYVPHALPAEYDIVDAKGVIAGNTYETNAQARARAEDTQRVYDLVWWRRVIYFATLLLTALLVLFPWIWTNEYKACTQFCWLQDSIRDFIRALLTAAGNFLPGFASPWIEIYRVHPVKFALFAVLLVGALLLGRWLEARIRERASGAWSHVSGKSAPPLVWGPWSRSARLVRSRHWLVVLYRWVARRALPFAFVALVAFGVLALLNRALFDVAEAAGFVCPPGDDNQLRVVDGKPLPIVFATKELCYATGIWVEEGNTYTVKFTIRDAWRDGSKDTNPIGFRSIEGGARFLAFAPFRRIWGANWFEPIARIGAYGKDAYPLRPHKLVQVADGASRPLEFVSQPFTARSGGQLFVFVNDAVLAVPGRMSKFYDGILNNEVNNKGTADITVTHVAAKP